MLREVKYLNFQQQKEIPSSAENLFSQYETFRKFVGNLELIAGWYNEVSWCCFVLFATLGVLFRTDTGVRSPRRTELRMFSYLEVVGATLWGEPMSSPFPPSRVARVPWLEATSRHLRITAPLLLLSCSLPLFFLAPSYKDLAIALGPPDVKVLNCITSANSLLPSAR